jgi:hypothetical protein
VARPEYISSLHEAKYQLRFCTGNRKTALFKTYKEVLARASKQSRIPEPLLEAAVARDFGAWMKQQFFSDLRRELE